MNKEKDNSVLIPNKKIKKGLEIAKKNIEFLLRQCKSSFEDKNYQLSIPLAVLAFEESSKIFQLYSIGKDGDDITNNDWEQLRKHDVKLTGIDKEIKKELHKEFDFETPFKSYMLQSVGLNDVVQDKEQAIKVIEKTIEIQSRFSKIKEACLYTNWNKQNKDWDDFSKISLTEQKLINFMILYQAVHQFHIALLSIETMNNPFPKITDEEFGNLQKRDLYMKNKIAHFNDFQSIQKMRMFEENHKDSVNDLRRGLKLFNRYFSN